MIKGINGINQEHLGPKGNSPLTGLNNFKYFTKG